MNDATVSYHVERLDSGHFGYTIYQDGQPVVVQRFRPRDASYSGMTEAIAHSEAEFDAQALRDLLANLADEQQSAPE